MANKRIDAQVKKLALKLGVTDADLREIRIAAERVWSDVAYDCLQALADEKGKEVESVTMSRADVVEVVLDAGRIGEVLRKTHLTTTGWTFFHRWDNLLGTEDDRTLMRALMLQTFPYTRYGF